MGECDHTECEQDAVVRANGLHACQDHLDWVFEQAFAGVRGLLAAFRGRVSE